MDSVDNSHNRRSPTLLLFVKPVDHELWNYTCLWFPEEVVHGLVRFSTVNPQAVHENWLGKPQELL